MPCVRARLCARAPAVAGCGVRPATAARSPSPPRAPPLQKSKWSIKPRSIQFHIIKKESGPHWPTLTKDKAREKGQVTIDWTRYVDEDEEKGGFDMSGMGGGMNFGGGMGDDDMGGMGGMGVRGKDCCTRAPARAKCGPS